MLNALVLWIGTALACAESPGGGPPAPGELDAGRVFATATLVGSEILVAGGLADERQLASARGDAVSIGVPQHGPPQRDWAPRAFPRRLLPGRFLHAAVALDAGRVLLAGGDVGGTVDLYGPGAGTRMTFSFAGRLPGGARAALTATRLADGRVFIAGGMRLDRSPSDATDLYDPKTGAITAGPALLHPRASHTATLLADGRVLLAGGVGAVERCELFDPESAAMVEGPRLATGRDDHRALRLADGRVLIAGGQGADLRSLASCEIVGADGSKVEPGPALREARADHVMVERADGSVLVLGGELDDGAGADRVLASVEEWQPGAGEFHSVAPLKDARDDAAGVLLQDGRVLLAGGQGADGKALIALEMYGRQAAR